MVWYVDNAYTENWTGLRPGDGFLGVVDADQKTLKWSDSSVASTRYQVHDAAFNIEKGNKMFLDYKDLLGLTLTDKHTKSYEVFKDTKDYTNPGLPDAGRNVPEYGIKIEVLDVAYDDSAAKIKISKKNDRGGDDDDEDDDDDEEDDD